MYRDIAVVAEVLGKSGIQLIIWGENAMHMHGIPTVIIRNDIVVADAMLDKAAAALRAEGWTDSTTPLPNPVGFWLYGWEVVGAVSRRFQSPKSLDVPTREVVILPSTFVGLGDDPSVDSPDFTRSGENVYLPTAQHLARTIVHVRLRPDTIRSFALLMESWAAYFVLYCNFDKTSLDGKDDMERKYWQGFAPEVDGPA